MNGQQGQGGCMLTDALSGPGSEYGWESCKGSVDRAETERGRAS